jgi:hypothetical protein
VKTAEKRMKSEKREKISTNPSPDRFLEKRRTLTYLI